MRKWLICSCIFLASCSYIASHPDSPLEELAEEGIKAATGLDVDLSSDDGA